MKPKPYFSIVIPALNEARYLPNLLKDLTAQTNRDFEVIIVDGHSEDKTVKNAAAFNQQLNLTIINCPKRNVCTQRNLGAKKAQGNWLLFMDADNRLPDYFIQGLRYQIDKHHPDFFTTHLASEGNHPLDKTIAQVFNTTFEAQKNTKHPNLMESMVGIRYSAYKKVSGFDEKVKWAEGRPLARKYQALGYRFDIFKEPKYVYSLRRIKKEGTLKALRNGAKLIFAEQAGIKLKPKTIQKLYPMKGGAFFDEAVDPTNPIERVILDLMKKYQIPQMVKKLNQPITISNHSITRFFAKKPRSKIS